MDLKSQNILFLTRTMKLGGTENVILQLCEIFKPLVNNIIVCSCGGVNVKKLNDMGIKHYLIPDIQVKKPSEVIKTLLIIRNIVKIEHITVVHSHHRMAAFYTELLFGKNIIKIANAHNTFVDKKKLTQFSYRDTYVIAVGEKVKENLVDFYGISEKQVTVIHNAIKPFDGEIKTIKELKDAKTKGYTIVGNIGRLSEQKGMIYFIKAAAKVLESYPMTRFFIVGDGELKEELKMEAEKMLPEENMQFLGYRSDIQNVISQLDFVVLSSLWEGLPLTPIEAFSVGKPVVATAVDGTPEIIDNLQNGLLVKAKDVDGLSKAIVEMISNSTKRMLLGDNAYKRYIDEFSFTKMAEKYIAFFEKLDDVR